MELRSIKLGALFEDPRRLRRIRAVPPVRPRQSTPPTARPTIHRKEEVSEEEIPVVDMKIGVFVVVESAEREKMAVIDCKVGAREVVVEVAVVEELVEERVVEKLVVVVELLLVGVGHGISMI